MRSLFADALANRHSSRSGAAPDALPCTLLGRGAARLVAVQSLQNPSEATRRPSATFLRVLLIAAGLPQFKGLLFGHRGCRLPNVNIPENSMLSFNYAWENGAQGIECARPNTSDSHTAFSQAM